MFSVYTYRIMGRFSDVEGETLKPGNHAVDVELAPFHHHEDAVPVEVVEMLAALDDTTRALYGHG